MYSPIEPIAGLFFSNSIVKSVTSMIMYRIVFPLRYSLWCQLALILLYKSPT